MSDLDQRKLEAEINNLLSQTAKVDAKRESLRKTWRDWLLEVIKVGGALVLGVGGITAAITGYQLSEVRKERTDFETLQERKQLEDLTQQKLATQQDLTSIKAEIEGLQSTLETARKAKTETSQVLDDAINRAAGIGKAVAMTNAQLRAQPTPVTHSVSDYLVGLQTLGVDDGTREKLNQKIHDQDYSLHELSASYKINERPSWFAPKSTVFYYAPSALPAARQLAAVMKQLTGDDFAVQAGSGLGVDPSQRAVTLFVHYVKK